MNISVIFYRRELGNLSKKADGIALHLVLQIKLEKSFFLAIPSIIRLCGQILLSLKLDSVKNLKRANMLINSETRIFVPSFLSKTVNGKKLED